MKRIIVLFALSVTLLFTGCNGGPAPEKTDLLPATGTFAYEFPDRLFRREILNLLNEHDAGNRNDSSKISAQDYIYMASLDKLDVSSFNHRLFDLANPEFVYNKNRGIANLKGIEYFTALKELFCPNNQLKEIDLSKNTQLKYLFCNNNKLERLDLTNNPALEVLICHENYLTGIDLSKNVCVKELGFESNRLIELELSNNTMLRVLKCYNNKLTKLDLSNNTQLEELDCTLNYIESKANVVGLREGVNFYFELQWLDFNT